MYLSKQSFKSDQSKVTFVLLNIQQLNCVFNKFDELGGGWVIRRHWILGETVKHHYHIIVPKALTQN